MDYEQWDFMVRTLAGFDPVQAQVVADRWTLRDALLAMEHHIRVRAREDYQQAMIVWASIAPFQKKGSGLKPPRLPRILRGQQ